MSPQDRPTSPPPPGQPFLGEQGQLEEAYANIISHTGHWPFRHVFEKVIISRGRWSKDRFDAWADQRSWR